MAQHQGIRMGSQLKDSEERDWNDDDDTEVLNAERALELAKKVKQKKIDKKEAEKRLAEAAREAASVKKTKQKGDIDGQNGDPDDDCEDFVSSDKGNVAAVPVLICRGFPISNVPQGRFAKAFLEAECGQTVEFMVLPEQSTKAAQGFEHIVSAPFCPCVYTRI